MTFESIEWDDEEEPEPDWIDRLIAWIKKLFK